MADLPTISKYRCAVTFDKFEPLEILPNVLLRVTSLRDAGEFAEAYVRNQDHLRRWDPRRPDEFFTEQGQRQRISGLLEAMADERALPLVLVADGRIAGMVNLGGLSMGPFRSAGMGYWVDVEQAGRRDRDVRGRGGLPDRRRTARPPPHPSGHFAGQREIAARPRQVRLRADRCREGLHAHRRPVAGPDPAPANPQLQGRRMTAGQVGSQGVRVCRVNDLAECPRLDSNQRPPA